MNPILDAVRSHLTEQGVATHYRHGARLYVNWKGITIDITTCPGHPTAINVYTSTDSSSVKRVDLADPTSFEQLNAILAAL